MEFANRSDGYPGLQKLYGLNFKSVKGIDGGLIVDPICFHPFVTDAFIIVV